MSSGSVLAVDFGSATTRVVMFDVVDGEYRLVARGETQTTLGTPADDISVGLKRVLRTISQTSGRRFLDAQERVITPEGADRSGVDLFVTTSSAGRPLRAAVVGLLNDVSIKSALTALSTSYIEVTATLTLEGDTNEEAEMNAILLSEADIIFMVGGTDGGAIAPLEKLLKGVHTALKVGDASTRPIVVFAGNRKFAPIIQQTLSELTQVFIAPNVRPTLEEEALEGAQLELGQAYDRIKERSGEGFVSIGEMSGTGVLPTAQSYTLMAEYLAHLENANVLAVDIGGGSSVLVGVFNGKPSTRINPRKGLGQSAKALLDWVGADAIKSWLPFNVADSELEAYALNKTLRPHTIPMTLRELYIEHAFLRVGLRDMVQNARALWDNVSPQGALPSINTIIVGGAPLTKTGSPFYDMLLVADCLQPSGITEIYADPHAVIAALGALAQINPEATVQLMDANNLDYLGTLVNIEGNIAYDKTVAKVKVKTGGQTVEVPLMGGHLLSLPVPDGGQLELDIRLSRGFTIQGKRRIKQKFDGSKGGVLIDARGRLFTPPASIQERAKWLPLWVHEATDIPLLAIPEEWLQTVTSIVKEAKSTAKDTGKKASAPDKKARKKQTGTLSPLDNEFDALLKEDADDDFLSLLNDEPPKKQTDSLDELKGLF